MLQYVETRKYRVYKLISCFRFDRSDFGGACIKATNKWHIAGCLPTWKNRVVWVQGREFLVFSSHWRRILRHPRPFQNAACLWSRLQRLLQTASNPLPSFHLDILTRPRCKETAILSQIFVWISSAILFFHDVCLVNGPLLILIVL